MIPILYEQNEREFKSGGLGFLVNCTSCIVSQERNGVYECEFVYPITGPKYSLIQEGRIIFATHDNSGKPQPFDIYARSAPINGLVTFYAHHISYRLGRAVVMPFTAQSIKEAMQKIQANTVGDLGFTFWTDKTTTGEYKKELPSFVRPTLGGEEGSLLDRYGRGDYVFDKFAVKLYQNVGRDTDVEIRYGKNMVKLEHKIDESSTYNAIVPYWMNAETGEMVTLPEGYVSHDDGSAYIKAMPYPMDDYFSSKPTVAQMRTKAKQLLDSSDSWVPSERFSVDFVQLWQTEEYKDYAPLQEVNLCDTVRVYYPELGVNAVKERVVKTEYNTLLDRYNSMELNELPTTLTGMVQQQVSAEVGASDTVTADSMNAAINLAIQLIRGGLGGYILMTTDSNGQTEYIYIMDQPRPADAVNVIRLGSDGISRSTNGIDGEFYPVINIVNGALKGDLTGNVTGNLSGNVTGNVNGNVTGNVTGQILSILLSGSQLGQILGFDVLGENVLGVKATNPFVLTDGTGALGYRYGGTAGPGSYGAPHYYKGDVIIDGNLTVTGTINNGGN